MPLPLLSAPSPLLDIHILDLFDSGEPALDNWLRQRARNNHSRGASRVFVVSDPDQRVLGYYALAAGAIKCDDAPTQIRRNMPDPIPVLVLGRLAVDRSAQGHKIGAGMLQDAVNRAAEVAENIGVRALLVHALHERARDFYAYYGFQPSTIEPLTLMLRLAANRP